MRACRDSWQCNVIALAAVIAAPFVVTIVAELAFLAVSWNGSLADWSHSPGETTVLRLQRGPLALREALILISVIWLRRRCSTACHEPYFSEAA